MRYRAVHCGIRGTLCLLKIFSFNSVLSSTKIVQFHETWGGKLRREGWIGGGWNSSRVGLWRNFEGMDYCVGARLLSPRLSFTEVSWIFSYARQRPHFDTNANFLPRRGTEAATTAVFVVFPREVNMRSTIRTPLFPVLSIVFSFLPWLDSLNVKRSKISFLFDFSTTRAP